MYKGIVVYKGPSDDCILGMLFPRRSVGHSIEALNIFLTLYDFFSFCDPLGFLSKSSLYCNLTDVFMAKGILSEI